MKREHSRSGDPCPRGTSRREFIKLAATAGLLAGCRPAVRQVMVTTTPTATPVLANTPTRTAVNKVVCARYTGVWDGDVLVPEAIQQMLDASIVALTSYQQLPDADLPVLAQVVSSRLLGAGPGDGWLPGMVRGRR